METGETVPDFTLPDETGERRTLSELLAGGPVVLFFFPKAMSKGCTAEACHFRDLAADLSEVGASPVGISFDAVDKQSEFVSAHSLGYPLLADPDGEAAKLFGVKRGFGIKIAKRQTFVIDTDRTVIGRVRSETDMNLHADRALELLREHRKRS
ncbi:peroxiredoxin [Glycomyces xiaoerkulensis]|uniref:peroxiredoxin n=1 Tax=Glycomyces xiaoerkulensis TaxID=2038139 RepID=UPI000C269057|nr:peroxiredoxin [Glycomyces xiaoerkulensis]